MKTERRLPLNSLRTFEAAGRYESFLYAAGELRVSPGAVSRHVRQLERYLGAALFVRQSNGVTLTPAGNRYARNVNRIARDLRRATAEARGTCAAAGP